MFKTQADGYGCTNGQDLSTHFPACMHPRCLSTVQSIKASPKCWIISMVRPGWVLHFRDKEITQVAHFIIRTG